MGELDLVLKILDAGASVVLAVMVFLLMRSERSSRELDRMEDRAAIAELRDTAARIDERTAQLVGDVTPVERPPRPSSRRTPPLGAPTEYAYTRPRGGR